MPDASAGRPDGAKRSPVRVGGLGGREGATKQPKRIICYEMYFKKTRSEGADVEGIHKILLASKASKLNWY